MLTKTVYSYDNDTKEYIGETVAYESPRRPDTYLIPANTTDIMPPEAGAHEVAVFGEEGWVLKSNYRGNVYYDTETKEQKTITEIGVEPDLNWTEIAPADTDAVWNGEAWEVPFETLKARKAAEILALSANKMSTIEAGYSLGEVKTFEQQYQGAVDLLDGNSGAAAAQFVIALAAKRSEVGGVEITADDLAQRIIANYTAAKEYTVYILGIQQGLVTRAQLATTAEEVTMVVWPE